MTHRSMSIKPVDFPQFARHRAPAPVQAGVERAAAAKESITRAPLRVLIVEDSDNDGLLIVHALTTAGYEVVSERIETASQMRAALARRAWDIVIADYSLPQFDGRAALALLQATGQDIPFIVVSGTIGEETAVAMMQAGAHDYLLKGHLERLAPAIARELAQAETRRDRHRAQVALQASEERFRLLVEGTQDYAIFMLDAGGHIESWNSGAQRIYGYTADEITGQHFSRLYPEADVQQGKRCGSCPNRT